MYPLKFEPVLKQTLWGGDKIIPFKHLNENLLNVGESWEVSAVEGSESVVANGADKGLTLPEMVRRYREELVGEGNYARFGNKFPLLVKFIDARQKLSIQVHPGDELAKKRHNSFGKNEMWYVVSADEGATLISGFSRQITPKEYKERVHNGTFDEVLQTCAIRPGMFSMCRQVVCMELVPVHSLSRCSSLLTSLIVFMIIIEGIRTESCANCTSVRHWMPLTSLMCKMIFEQSMKLSPMNRLKY